MKKRILLSLLCAGTFLAQAQVTPRWLRNCAISPDGTTIAFTYKGDIYTVDSNGGEARQLTSQSSYDSNPVWSPCSKKLAFSSNREGSVDIYIVGKDGGTPKRLTTNSGEETPTAFLNEKEILFTTAAMPGSEYGQFPSNTFAQVYKVSTEGGRPELFSSEKMENPCISSDGKTIIYHDCKGYEDKWRKHHTSSITRDIWMTNIEGERKFTKLTTNNGEDRNPVWAADNDTYYYLSEQGGSANIFRASVSGKTKSKQVSKHSKHPVRFLSIAKNGTMCYAYDGDIYTIKDGEAAKKVKISITADIASTELSRVSYTRGATAVAPMPDGKEVAFVVRGDVFVTTTDYTTTRRITDTPEQERNVDVSPDGRSIVYSAERNGVWGIYISRIVREDDKYFTYAAEIKEEPLVVTDKASFQPKFSPDGKEVAFLEDRTTLRVIDLKSKKVRTVLPGKYNYSYSDGDQDFAWSPDGKWFLVKYIAIGGWNNTDIALVKADGSEIHNLTESGYSDAQPRWVLDGKGMIWSSDRAGYRSHGSWGSHRDIYIMFFDAEEYDKFRMNKEELAMYNEEKKQDKEKADKAKAEEEKKKEKKDGKDKKEGDKKEKDDKKEEKKALTFDLANRHDRIIRLTRMSGGIGDAVLTSDGSKLYYQANYNGSMDLWEYDTKEGGNNVAVKNFGGGKMYLDKDGKFSYSVSGAIKKFELASKKVTDINFNAEYNYRPLAEREYIFDHVWRQVKDKFYVKDIHGVDWEYYGKEYRKFLPHIANNVDFADLLSELLGELNASHTGARSGLGSNYNTAVLGAFYDENHTGDGLKIKEILKNSPLVRYSSKIKNGDIIEAIDGEMIEAGKDYYPILVNKAGKKVRLSMYSPKSKERWEEWVKPISKGTENEMLYNRWVERRREMVDSLSGGRIGYIHIKEMNSNSFRKTYSELLGKYRNHEAILIDTRHNGGGWLHEDLAVLLSGKEYQRFEPRGQYIGSDPFTRWTKPSAVLMCEDNYSNAHGFPATYKALGLGKLIGAPVPGTMTAVWWETQIDQSIVFGVPQVAVKDMNGNYLENQLLMPDIEVYNTPEDNISGRDRQIEAGVKHLLEVIGKK